MRSRNALGGLAMVAGRLLLVGSMLAGVASVGGGKEENPGPTHNTGEWGTRADKGETGSEGATEKGASGAEKDKKEAVKEAAKPSYEMPQPAVENLDLTMYQSIREEATKHSHIMEYASGLMDGIGPRLTGSPNLKKANEWTKAQLTAMGCSNAHLEDWGEFGMGWQQLNTWVRMSAPDTAVFIAQAAPWSPATKGTVSAAAVWVDLKDERDFEKYKGKLAGKIVLFGDMRPVPPVDKPLFERYDDAALKKIEDYPTKLGGDRIWMQNFMKRLEWREKVGKFLAAEQAVAVISPSRDGR